MKKIVIIAIVLTILTFILPVMAVWGLSSDENDPEEIIPENAIKTAGTTMLNIGDKSTTDTDLENDIDSTLMGMSDTEIIVRVEMSGQIDTMTLQHYLLGVVTAEMPASFPAEALKAQAVAARTYTYSRMRAELAGNNAHDNADVCTNPAHCKAYTDWEQQVAVWDEMGRDDYSEKILDAVKGTDREVILYDSKPIVAVFHAASGEFTENAKDIWGSEVPYLISVESPNGADYKEKNTVTIEEFKDVIYREYPDALLVGEHSEWFGEIVHTPAGGVSSINVGGVKISGKEMRALFDLPSSNIEISTKKDVIVFNTKGYGHCVGMSQYGARVLALKGKNYQDILHWYYTDVEIRKYE